MSDMLNELSTSGKPLFFTPDTALAKMRGRDQIDDIEDGSLPMSFLSANPQNKGDRFIPKRGSPISRQLFNMPENLLTSPLDVSNKNEKEQNSLIFENLLEHKLLRLKFDQISEPAKDAGEGFNFAFSANKSVSSKSVKTQTPPVKKMNEHHVIIKRPKLLDFSDKKSEKEAREEISVDPMLDNKVIKQIRDMRKIAKVPYKVLDAPGLDDDYYQVTNLVFLNEPSGPYRRL